MATRALIGYFDDDRVLTSTYNHYDGYPDHLGNILNKYYNANGKARNVANKGYISYFEDDGDIVSKNPEKKPYKLNLKGEFEDALYSISQEIDSFGADYAYIWYNEEGYWIEIKNTGTQGVIDQLSKELDSAATMFGPVDEDRKVFDYNKLTRKQIEDLEDLKLKKENMILDKVKEIKPLFPGMDDKILVDFVKTHIEDIRGASDEDIKDEFEEFFSVNYETGADYMEEENIGVDLSDAAAGDSAIEKESASGAFEEAVNWRGETLKEQFKRLSK